MMTFTWLLILTFGASQLAVLIFFFALFRAAGRSDEGMELVTPPPSKGRGRGATQTGRAARAGAEPVPGPRPSGAPQIAAAL